MNQIEYNRKIMDYFAKHDISFETEFIKDPSMGAKSLLFKDKEGFKIFTLRADTIADNKKVRKILKSQKLRFASNQELMDIAGVISGALPPFGRPFIDIDHYVDRKLLENQFIAFNAAIIGERIKLNLEDYLGMVNPTLCDFIKE